MSMAAFGLAFATPTTMLTQQTTSGTTGRGTMTQSTQIPIPSAAFDGDRPVGLFYRLKVGFTSGNRLELHTRLFLPGNRFSRTFPFGGGDVFDQTGCNPDMCGTFEHTGSDVAVRWDNGQVDRWTYKRTPDGFELDGDSFKPARGLAQATLVGTWAGATNTGNASENVYTFRPDGTFSFGAGQRGAGGRYSLKGLTLTLDFADGTKKRRTLFAAGSGDPVGLIAVEGDVYRRQ
jgi:hypothetical protein